MLECILLTPNTPSSLFQIPQSLTFNLEVQTANINNYRGNFADNYVGPKHLGAITQLQLIEMQDEDTLNFP